MDEKTRKESEDSDADQADMQEKKRPRMKQLRLRSKTINIASSPPETYPKPSERKRLRSRVHDNVNTTPRNNKDLDNLVTRISPQCPTTSKVRRPPKHCLEPDSEYNQISKGKDSPALKGASNLTPKCENTNNTFEGDREVRAQRDEASRGTSGKNSDENYITTVKRKTKGRLDPREGDRDKENSMELSLDNEESDNGEDKEKEEVGELILDNTESDREEDQEKGNISPIYVDSCESVNEEDKDNEKSIEILSDNKESDIEEDQGKEESSELVLLSQESDNEEEKEKEPSGDLSNSNESENEVLFKAPRPGRQPTASLGNQKKRKGSVSISKHLESLVTLKNMYKWKMNICNYVSKHGRLDKLCKFDDNSSLSC